MVKRTVDRGERYLRSRPILGRIIQLTHIVLRNLFFPC